MVYVTAGSLIPIPNPFFLRGSTYDCKKPYIILVS
jgi:hypothetical protein